MRPNENQNNMEAELLLEINELVVEYHTEEGIVHALNDFNLKVPVGKTVGLVGETGAGKTTTALSILKLIQSPPGKIISGSIKYRDIDIIQIPEEEMEEIRGSEISMIFQDPMTSLNPVMTVEEQIAEGIELHEKISAVQSVDKAREILELVGIPADRGTDYPHQFSGGMKQRVVIAIALSCNPKLLIADEPTTALDVTIQAQILEMMKELREKYQTSMIMITHDLGIIAEICDEVSIMYAGEVIERGNLEDIFNHYLHPYTEGLFRSLPDIDNRNEKLKPIKGLMPDPIDLPNGCPFHPRCDYALDICSKVHPRIIMRSKTHGVKCHLYNADNIQYRRLESIE